MMNEVSSKSSHFAVADLFGDEIKISKTVEPEVVPHIQKVRTCRNISSTAIFVKLAGQGQFLFYCIPNGRTENGDSQILSITISLYAKWLSI